MTPIIGMMPAVVFVFFDCFFSYPAALVAAVVVYIMYFLIGVVLLKQALSYIIRNSIRAFLLFVACSMIKPFSLLYAEHASVMLELGILLVFFIFLRIQGYFRTKLIREKGKVAQEFLLLEFDSDLNAMKLISYLVSFHLAIVLIYQLFPAADHTPALDRVLYYYLLFLFIILHYTYEFVHWSLIKRQIQNEEWLPIVDESGAVHGKVALSISITDDKYLHPEIRIVLIHKGKLFLKQKTSESGRLDYPFERYLRFQETLEEGIKQAFIRNGGTEDLPCHFIFRYIYKETNRLVYLYACNITDEKELDKLHLEDGKWWTTKQVDENLGTGLFSPYFEKEYEILSTTVLPADRLMNDI
jgi:hypothetical protein